MVADLVFDGAMQIMITKSEARNLLCEYIATIDRGKLREWPNFFAETSVYRIATRENEERGLPLSIMLCNRLKARGGAGIVTDGGYRDTHEVASLGFPAYQTRTVPPPSFLHLHAVEMNQPIGCARVAVYPGDIVVGDGEGVVVILAHLANEVAEEAHQMTLYDTFAAEKIEEGRSIFGIYPATDSSQAEFANWRHKRK